MRESLHAGEWQVIREVSLKATENALPGSQCEVTKEMLQSCQAMEFPFGDHEFLMKPICPTSCISTAVCRPKGSQVILFFFEKKREEQVNSGFRDYYYLMT